MIGMIMTNLKETDQICITSSVLCLREASKHIKEIDPEMSQALLELAAALISKFNCDHNLINEMESIKNEFETC